MTRLMESLRYEVALAAEGMDPGQAKAEAVFRAVEDGARRAGRSVDELGAKVGPAAAKGSRDFEELTRQTLRWEASLGTIGETVKTTAAAATHTLAREYQRAIATIRSQLAEGLIDRRQAEQQGREAGLAFNQGLAEIIREARTAGALESERGQDIFAALAQRFKDVDTSGRSAAVGLSRLQRPLTTLTTQAIGARAGIGTLVSQLGVLGAGATVTIAVTAGLGAIVALFRSITRETREARRELNAYIDRLLHRAQAEKEATTAGLQSREQELRDVIRREKQIREAAQRVRVGRQTGAPLPVPVSQAQIDAEEALTQNLKDQQKLRADIAEKDSRTEQERAATVGRLLRDERTRNTVQAEANDLIARYNRELADTRTTDERRVALLGMLDALQRVNREHENAAQRSARALQQMDAAGRQLEGMIAALTPGREDDLAKRRADIEATLRNAKWSEERIAEGLARLDQAHRGHLEELTRETGMRVAELIAQTTATVVDDMELALQRLIGELEQMPGITRAQIQQVVALRREAIAAMAAIEASRSAMEAVDESVRERDIAARRRGGRRPTLFEVSGELSATTGNIVEATMQRAQLQAALAVTTATAEQRRLKAEILKLDEKILALEERMRTTGTQLNRIDALRLQQLQAQAHAIESSARGALQLAEAFRLVSSETVSVLSDIVQIGANIRPLIGQIQALRSGAVDEQGKAIASIGSVIGAALPVVGAVASLAAAILNRARVDLEAQERNTEAIRRLTDRVGDLGRINVTGTDVGRFGALLRDPRFSDPKLRATSGLLGDNSDAVNRAIGRILDDFRISASELKKFAEKFDVILGTGPGGRITLDDIERLKEAIYGTELSKFADDFAGQMGRLNAEIALFSLESPIDQFEAFRRAVARVSGGTGLLDSLLASVDLTTAAGLEAAREMIRELFERSQNQPLTAAELGGLTGQEFIDALLKLSGYIDDIAKSGHVAGTGGYNIDRSITEVTGARVAAMLATANVWHQRTAEAAEKILQAITGGSSVIPQPTLPAPRERGDSAEAACAIAIEQITVNQTINLTAAPDEAPAVGRRIGRAAAAEISEALGREMMWRKRARGIM